jgi:hypothetical protein
VILEEVVCNLKNGGSTRTSRDDLITTRDEASQMVLLEEKKEALHGDAVNRVRERRDYTAWAAVEFVIEAAI